MGITGIRKLTIFLLALSPATTLNLAAIAITEPSFSSISRLWGALSSTLLFALWLSATKGYALFAKTYGEL